MGGKQSIWASLIRLLVKRINSKFRNKEYVDLGLPSGLKWAKCNIGAKKETDYGSYFQWGDIGGKSNADCCWENYKHCDAFHLGRYLLAKYCTDGLYGTVDNKITLGSEDDVVTQIMGGKWRMPTKDDFQELLDNTDNEWVEDFNGTGMNGRKFTSKTDTIKYIFFPAAGYRDCGSVDDVGLYGDVWSSSLNTSRPYSAWYLHFNKGICTMYYCYRFDGRSVRGVMD